MKKNQLDSELEREFIENQVFGPKEEKESSIIPYALIFLLIVGLGAITYTRLNPFDNPISAASVTENTIDACEHEYNICLNKCGKSELPCTTKCSDDFQECKLTVKYG